MSQRILLALVLAAGVGVGAFARDLVAALAVQPEPQAVAPPPPPPVVTEPAERIGVGQLFPTDPPAEWDTVAREELAARLDARLLGSEINAIVYAGPPGRNSTLLILFESIDRTNAYQLVAQLDTASLRDVAGFENVWVLARPDTHFTWRLDLMEGKPYLPGPLIERGKLRLR